MKFSRKIIVAVGIIGLLGTISLTAFASSSKWSPAETLADLTGRTTQSIADERASGKHYGTIAKDAGQLEDFQREAATAQREIYAELVKEGKVQQEQADAAIAAADKQRAICDGTGQGGNNVCGDCELGYCPAHGVGNSGQGNNNVCGDCELGYCTTHGVGNSGQGNSNVCGDCELGYCPAHGVGHSEQVSNNVCGDCELGYCPTHGVGNSGQGNNNGGGYGHGNGYGNGDGYGNGHGGGHGGGGGGRRARDGSCVN